MDTWREIFASLSKNWLRTLLSGFTVTLGLFIFITLFGMGNGLQNSFARDFIRGAANTISIRPGFTNIAYKGHQANRIIQFENKDLDFLKEEYGDQLRFYTSQLNDNVRASFQSEFGSYSLTATQPDFLTIQDNEIIKGRTMTANDLENKDKVVIIGRLVEQDLFNNASSLNEFININGFNYEVVGVFSDEDGDNEERIIYTPLSTYQQVKKSTRDIDRITLGYNPSQPAAEVMELGNEVKDKLKQRFEISPEDSGGIYIRNSAESQAGSQGFLFVLTVIIVVIGFGTLIAGMMGIFNIMVYSVQERTKEIGIRKALGAKPMNIIQLILYESVVITLVSGIVGIILGISFLNSISDSLEDYFITDPSVSNGLIIFALFCLVFAGVIAGFIPSYRASKVKPIEALRSE